MTSTITPAKSLEQLAIDTIRCLAIDEVQQANSGHPGAPMGMAPMAYVLWTEFLRHAPTRPDWPDRDRFVLSAGHASALLYALLHLTGYDLPMEELKRFRQWGSRTPGHPEHGLTAGVEATTGPLGQGISNAIGMAIAERRLAAEFGRPRTAPIVDHRTYAICSDGDLQEGVSGEASSLAGHLRLGKLICLYDDNHIQLDGPTSMAWSEDVLARYVAYGWHTQRVSDGNDTHAIRAAIEAAREDPRPSLIAVRTHIGYGSPDKQDSSKAHGSPLGVEEVRRTKEAYGWDPDLSFYVPEAVLEHLREAVPAGERLVADWERRFEAYAAGHPAEAASWRRRQAGELPPGWADGLPTYGPDDALATRNASQAAIQALAGSLPELFGGAADLSESNLTDVKDATDFEADQPRGRNLRFGVREHAMGAIANGVALHRGLLPYAGTFLNFSDYMRGAVRLAALSRLHVTYVWTHDSVGLGEDGPTHQPVEHYAALRAMPGLLFVRPGDPNEAIAAWRLAVEHREGPVALSLTRQKLPVLAGSAELAVDGVARGGYILADALDGAGTVVTPDVILIATGSELQLAMGARDGLAEAGIRARVVSLPCWERFSAQPSSYRDTVLPPGVAARVSIEAGVTLGWDRWVGPGGAMIGLERFGASAPGPTVMEHFGFSVAHVVDVARGVLEGRIRGPQGPTIDDPLPYGD